MQGCSDAGSVLGASDPRCRGALQRALREIMRSPGAPSQTRPALRQCREPGISAGNAGGEGLYTEAGEGDATVVAAEAEKCEQRRSERASDLAAAVP